MLTGFQSRLRTPAKQVTLFLKINMRRLTNWMFFFSEAQRSWNQSKVEKSDSWKTLL